MLVHEMDRYDVDILAVQEMRWTGDGIIERKKHTILYSCDPKKHMFGTGFIVGKRVKHLIIDFMAKSPRLCKIRIRGAFFNYSLINVHAPTEDKDDDEKEAFYEDLDDLYLSCPKSDIKIVLGDMNAKIGKETEFKPTIGRYSLHDKSNDNGHKLIDFAANHNMVISSSFFPHKRIHKMTWKSPVSLIELLKHHKNGTNKKKLLCFIDRVHCENVSFSISGIILASLNKRHTRVTQ